LIWYSGAFPIARARHALPLDQTLNILDRFHGKK
jgi:hypothetical protein